MLLISKLNFFLPQKVHIKTISEEEKTISYYDDTDTNPTKALTWINRINNKICLLPYADIGGKNNFSKLVLKG